jgi:hypothetical protein
LPRASQQSLWCSLFSLCLQGLLGVFWRPGNLLSMPLQVDNPTPPSSEYYSIGLTQGASPSICVAYRCPLSPNASPHRISHLLESCSLATPWGNLPWCIETQRLGLGLGLGLGLEPREGCGTVCRGAQGRHWHPLRPHHSLQPDSFRHVPGDNRPGAKGHSSP